MATGWSLRTPKKMMLLCVETMLQLEGAKATLTTKTKAKTKASALKETDAHGDGNANNSSGVMDISGDVRTLCKQGKLKEALEILQVMDERGIRADPSIYASLLQGCVNKKALAEGKLVHTHMTDRGFKPDNFLSTKLVIMYAKCGSLVEARRVFDRMPKRNVVAWTAMIAAYSKHGFDKEALRLFYQMQETGIQPDQFTFASVLPACANLADLEHGKKVHEAIIRSGFLSDVFVGSALVDMYVKCRSVEDARHVFDKMPKRDVVAWNAMIAGYAQNGHVKLARKLFQKMPEQNVVSWNTMLAGYVQNRHFDEALKLFKKIPELNVVSWTTMIAGFAQNGRVGEALDLFEKMPERNVVSWNAIIAGFAQNGHFSEALKLFREMQLTEAKPNTTTLASVLPACSNLTVIKHGKEVHEHIVRNGFQSDIFVGNALIDMYAKCGSIEYARQVFDKMPKRNVISWTAMIVGYAMHGHGKEAVQLFEQMQQSGKKPNHATFAGVLSACCSAGLLDDGRRYFDCMSRDYHLTPAVKHFCCMVDILGRAGLLDEAEGFIKRMPLKADAAVWGSLLGACRTHMNIELGERVAERLFKLEPKNFVHYVQLSSMYATAGKWSDVEKVGKMMKDRNVKRILGCSWIEVNNKLHTFLGGDKPHPQIQKIYAKWELLIGQMKEAGYVADMNFVLHEVDKKQEEHILCHHSEKLAVAFGLINTSPWTPIRAVKNLRVCDDCHSAIKFISKIVAREIIVRDTNRFHHFKEGQCSCGDYW